MSDNQEGGALADVGVIGGSGLYALLEDVEQVELDTPFGPPSAPVTVGEVGWHRVAFLPRHGLGHTLPPHRVPYRANLWALDRLGVRSIFAPFACGSLQPHLRPGDFVVVDQIFDRTDGRDSTFFDGQGSRHGDERFAAVNHISFADPYDPELRRVAIDACKAEGVTVHESGTVVVMSGPRFSTRAESRWYSSQGWDVINMTQMPEAALATELGIPYAAIALITDFDVGLEDVEGVAPVTMDEVFAMLERNAEVVRRVLFRAIELLQQGL